MDYILQALTIHLLFLILNKSHLWVVINGLQRMFNIKMVIGTQS
jgi:hypothetical protein